jgi:uncharacterized protein YbjT (DUF2867 family)
MSMLVLVVGATGVLGSATTRCLVAAGHGVRGMTRHAARMRDVEALGAEPVIGNLADPASLARACAGVDRIFVAAHGALGRGRNRSEVVDDAGHRALIDAAREARVSRFVYTSALGVAPDHPVDFFRTKWKIEQYLASSGLPYVVLRPAAFMEWHAHAFNGAAVLKKRRAVIPGTGTKRRNFVAARDVAEVATRALVADVPRTHLLAVGGPRDFTNDEVAALYAHIAAVPARITHIPRAVLSLVGWIARPFHPGIARAMRLSSLPDDAFPETLDAVSSHIEREMGATTLEAFVRERVREYQARATTPMTRQPS